MLKVHSVKLESLVTSKGFGRGPDDVKGSMEAEYDVDCALIGSDAFLKKHSMVVGSC